MVALNANELRRGYNHYINTTSSAPSHQAKQSLLQLDSNWYLCAADTARTYITKQPRPDSKAIVGTLINLVFI